MPRRLFTILSAVSLLLFLAMLLAWISALVRSVAPNVARWAEPYAAWRDGSTRGYSIMATRAGLSLEARSLPWAPRVWPSRSIYDPSPDGVLESADGVLVRMHRFSDVSYLQFEKGHWDAIVGNGSATGPVHGDYISIPFWFLLPVFGTAPLIWGVRAMRQRRRNRQGLCRQCGYDLRATPDRCPECGMSIVSNPHPDADERFTRQRARPDTRHPTPESRVPTPESRN